MGCTLYPNPIPKFFSTLSSCQVFHPLYIHQNLIHPCWTYSGTKIPCDIFPVSLYKFPVCLSFPCDAQNSLWYVRQTWKHKEKGLISPQGINFKPLVSWTLDVIVILYTSLFISDFNFQVAQFQWTQSVSCQVLQNMLWQCSRYPLEHFQKNERFVAGRSIHAGIPNSVLQKPWCKAVPLTWLLLEKALSSWFLPVHPSCYGARWHSGCQ